MIFGQDRTELRRMYADAWRKACRGEIMSALEAQIAEVVAEHPEYHAAVGSPDLDASSEPEAGQSNPWLHMGLHLALRDQVATDRPPGVRKVFERIASRSSSRLDAEHRAIDCLAETLWQAQRDKRAPDELAYLEKLKRLV